MRKAAQRLQQSQYDRKLVKIVYRLQGQSKDTVVKVQRCKVEETHNKLRSRCITWQVYDD